MTRKILLVGMLCSAMLAGSKALPAGQPDAGSAARACQEARKLYDAGRLGAAIVEYDQAIRLDPNYYDGYRGRGLTYLRLGRNDRAAADFFKSDEHLGPYREQKFPGLGAYLDWRRAHDEYEDANRYLRSGDYDQAISMYKTALSIYPTFPQCLHNLAIALSKKGDHKQAALLCMEAISYRHTDWKFWKTLAIELFMQGRYRQALEDMQYARALHPPVPEEVEIIDSIENIKDAIRQQRARSFWW